MEKVGMVPNNQQFPEPLEKPVDLPAPFVFSRLPVRLTTYEGSGELLIWLLRRRLVEVGEVPVSEVVEHIGKDGSSPVQLADEMALAAELAWLKSALLLPQPEPEVLEAPEEEPTDGEPLRRKLLRHAAYGLAARFLAERNKQWSQMFPRPTTEETPAPLKELTVGNEPLTLLTEALRRVLARLASAQVKAPRRRLTVPQRIRTVLQVLRAMPDGTTTFEALCADCENLLEIVITFLAVLELVRRGWVGARQDEPFGSIIIFLQSNRSPLERVSGDDGESSGVRSAQASSGARGESA